MEELVYQDARPLAPILRQRGIQNDLALPQEGPRKHGLSQARLRQQLSAMGGQIRLEAHLDRGTFEPQADPLYFLKYSGFSIFGLYCA